MVATRYPNAFGHLPRLARRLRALPVRRTNFCVATRELSDIYIFRDSATSQQFSTTSCVGPKVCTHYHLAATSGESLIVYITNCISFRSHNILRRSLQIEEEPAANTIVRQGAGLYKPYLARGEHAVVGLEPEAFCSEPNRSRYGSPRIRT